MKFTGIEIAHILLIGVAAMYFGESDRSKPASNSTATYAQSQQPGQLQRPRQVAEIAFAKPAEAERK